MLSFNALKTTLLLAALTGLLMLLGGLLGGSGGVLVGLLLAAVMNLGSYWFSDRIALRMAGAREVSYAEAPELHNMVAQLARASGLPAPRIAVIDSEAPNAFATGRSAEHAVVAVTTGILRILDRRELAAVLAHELGHVRNRDILVSAVAATIAGVVTTLAQLGQWSLAFGGLARGDEDEEGSGGLLGSLVMLILAPVAATIIQLAVSRSREFGADETGARLSRDPEALASALEKLEAYSAHSPRRGPGSLAHVHRRAADRSFAAKTVQHTPAHRRARGSPTPDGRAAEAAAVARRVSRRGGRRAASAVGGTLVESSNVGSGIEVTPSNSAVVEG